MALAAPPDLSDHAVPVQPLARTYPRGLHIEPHSHDWGQLLYAMSGVMWVETPREALVVPPQRAVWLPPGVEHGIRVVSDLQMRNIYLRPALAATLDSQVQVIEVGGLLRELIVTLVDEGDNGDSAYYDAVVGLALLELQIQDRRAHAEDAQGRPQMPDLYAQWPKQTGLDRQAHARQDHQRQQQQPQAVFFRRGLRHALDGTRLHTSPALQ